MSAFSGFVNAALTFGLQSFLVKPKRGIYDIIPNDDSVFADIIAHAVIEENHNDTLEITDHPIEQGASISDHAFKLPAEVTLTLGWSNSLSEVGGILKTAVGVLSAVSPAVRTIANIDGIIQEAASIQSVITGNGIDQIKGVYQNLLRLQSSRSLFSLYTGKRFYSNMICQKLTTSTDFKSENSLIITMVCRQIIIVNTQTVVLEKSVQKNPKQTAAPLNKGKQQAVSKKGTPNGYL